MSDLRNSNPYDLKTKKDEGYLYEKKPNDYLTTETLSKIYVDQDHYKRAIQTYEILCLKYPKKSSFFADHIKKIKRLEKK